jgi:hypothetical protein
MVPSEGKGREAMSKEEVYRILVEFFLDSFREDPSGVGDWFAQGGNDIDEFYEIVSFDSARRQKEKSK